MLPLKQNTLPAKTNLVKITSFEQKLHETRKTMYFKCRSLSKHSTISCLQIDLSPPEQIDNIIYRADTTHF